MKEEERYNLYDTAVEKWGKLAQVMMAVEEMAELTQILIHTQRSNRKVTHTDLASEIADVKIMLEQMENVFMCSDLVSETMEIKLLRLKSRLNTG